MRRNRGRDQRVVLESLDEGSARCQPFGRRLRVGDRKLDDRLPEHAAQARLRVVAAAISSSK